MRFAIVLGAFLFPSVCVAEVDYECSFPRSRTDVEHVKFTQTNIVGQSAKMEAEGRIVDVVMRRGRYGTTFIDGAREGGALTVTVAYSIAAADGPSARPDHRVWIAAYSMHKAGLQSLETEQIRGECRVSRS